MLKTLKELQSILESGENILAVLERKKEEHPFLNGYEKELGVRRKYAEALYAAYVLLTVNNREDIAGSAFYLYDCARKYTMSIADYILFSDYDEDFIETIKYDLKEAITVLEGLLDGIELL
jgi:hypothetical protein